MSLQPGDRFGRYEIVALLGRGGMGEVYRARDTVLHREVALKVLHPMPEGTGPEASPTQGAARILREARAAAGLTHPNAIGVYDVGEADGVPFLAMELVLGKPLRALIGDASVPLARRVRWMADVARALGAAHVLGLIHRDVKPENILVRADGVAKVLDFGIARQTVAKADPNAATIAATYSTVTAEGVVVGTPLYMAPEQMRGELLDGRADQFSWGVVAYELLTGKLPWNKDLPSLQLVAQILSGAIEAPRARNPEIGPIADTVIRKALAKVASERFASMDDVAEALEPEAAVAGPVASSRSRPAISSGDLASFAPTQAMPASGAHAQMTPSTLGTPLAGTTIPRTSPRRRWPAIAGVAAACAVAAGAWSLARSPRAAGVTAPDASRSAPAVVDSQMSPNAEATAAYRSGLQAFRDGALELASQQFRSAIVLDRSFAAARIHHAMLTDGQIGEQMSLNIQRARGARQSLGDVDRIFLDAMEPWTSSPPDLRESARRLEVAAREHPTNAEIEFQLGWTLHNAFETAQAVRAFDAALARDPTLAAAWCMKGREQVRLGDVTGATASYQHGLQVSQGATSCLADLAMLQANEGACAEMVETTRRLVAVAPEMAEAYGNLATALFGSGAPVEAVRSALRQKWERLPSSERKNFQLLDESYLATLSGHFDQAMRLDAEFEEEAAASSEEVVHLMPAVDRMLLALEEGRPAQAKRLAEEYLRRRASWQVDQLSVDPSIYVYDVEILAGVPGDDARLASARQQWMKHDQERGQRSGQAAAAYVGEEWVAAHAFAVSTPEDALAARAARPALTPLIDDLDVTPMDRFAMGRVSLLAGDADDAIAVSTRASASCAVLSQAAAPWAPIFSTWSAFDLGQALEAKGDSAGACGAYERVLDRWGKASPASRTADKARGRLRALRCDR